MKRLAKYHCLRCNHEWSTLIEGGIPPLEHTHSECCPKCGSLIFKWTNYEKDFIKT